jgi:hypothetical protein
MPVREASADAVSVGDLFQQGMQARDNAGDPATPPPVDKDAPHGRGDDGRPLAPFGYTLDGRPKLTAGGRKRKGDDGARITDHQPADDKKPGKTEPQAADRDADYSDGLTGAHDAVWAGITALSKIGPRIPVVGPRVPGTKLGAAAFVWHSNQAQMCGAFALAAKHNDSAARFAAKFASGQATWPIMCAAMVLPVAGAMAAVFAGDDRLAELELPATAELDKRNDAAMQEQIQATMDQFAQLAAEVQAAAA